MGSRPGTSETANAVKDAARDTVNTTKAEAANLAQDLKAQGEELVGAARERAQSLADEQKTAGADQVEGIARAARKAADELESTSPQLAHYVRDAASAAGNFSQSLRNRNLGEILEDVTEYARREPVMFFGITVAAGFAISRFLKSSAERSGAGRYGYGSRAGYAGGPGSSAGSSSYRAPASSTPVASTSSKPEYPTGRTTTTDPMGSPRTGSSASTSSASTSSASTSSAGTSSGGPLGSSAGNPASRPGATGAQSAKVGGPYR